MVFLKTLHVPTGKHVIGSQGVNKESGDVTSN